jgi:hypothetical protein
MAAKVEPLSKRILDRVEYDTNAGCWLWAGAMVHQTGYGTIGHGGRSHGAHRASYETFKGPIPAGLLVCHRCDNPSCVNPDHLFLGTVRDNAQDMIAKGRKPRMAGSSAPGALLHEDQIPIIRHLIAEGRGNREIGDQFGVTPDVINAIRAGRSWKCVPVDHFGPANDDQQEAA